MRAYLGLGFLFCFSDATAEKGALFYVDRVSPASLRSGHQSASARFTFSVTRHLICIRTPLHLAAGAPLTVAGRLSDERFALFVFGRFSPLRSTFFHSVVVITSVSRAALSFQRFHFGLATSPKRPAHWPQAIDRCPR